MKTKLSRRTTTKHRHRLQPNRSPRPLRPKPRSSVVTPKDITEAAVGLRGVARRTPLVFVEELGVHLKLENEQPIGAFKIRGAYNAIRKLPDAARHPGADTYPARNAT